jgi:hypothetical protein
MPDPLGVQGCSSIVAEASMHAGFAKLGLKYVFHLKPPLVQRRFSPKPDI